MSNLAEKTAGGDDQLLDPFLPFSLKKTFGKRYRVLMEESWQHETGENKKGQEAWYEIIPCRGFKPGPPQEGPFIGLFSEDPPTLQLFTTRVGNAKSIWNEINKHPGTRADFHLDGEAMIFFPTTPELLHKVAALAGARRRRVLSPEHKAKLLEAGKATRFNPDLHGSQVQKSTQNEAPGP